MYEIEIVKHKEKKEELINLFKICFSHSVSPEFWEWKYIRNPWTPDNPEVVVTTNNGTIVGARPFMSSEIWIKNEKIGYCNFIRSG